MLHSHHLVWRRCTSLVHFVWTSLLVLIVITTSLICEVLRSFVLMRIAVVVLETPYHLIDIAR